MQSCESEEFLKIVNNRDANGLRQFLETKRDYENSVKFPSAEQLKFLYDKSVSGITMYISANGDSYHGVLSLILWEYRMLIDYKKMHWIQLGDLLRNFRIRRFRICIKQTKRVNRLSQSRLRAICSLGIVD